MPAFDVTANPTTLEAKVGEKNSLVVTVTNRLGRPVTARASAVVDPAVGSAWIKAPPDAQKAFGQAATLEFQFGIEVPAAAPPGVYKVRIDVVDVEQPDDNFGQSPMIAVTVPKPPEVVVTQGGGGVPWWVWLVAALVIVGVGFGIWKAFFSSKGMPDLVKEPYAEAIAALDTSKFVITRVDTLNHDTTSFKRGLVISQSIAPKAKLAADSNVLRLVVQQSYAVVPNLVEMAPLDAVAKLGSDSLQFRQTFASQSTHTGEGKIASTDPVAGTLVARNTAVTFAVRTFSEPCTNPKICLLQATDLQLQAKWQTAAKLPVAGRYTKPKTP